MNVAPPALAAPNCPFGSGPQAHATTNELHLYFSPTVDTGFPDVDLPPTNPMRPRPTTPLNPFDVTQLQSYTGTSAELVDAIHDVVTDIYCEFNVEVLKTTTPPATNA